MIVARPMRGAEAMGAATVGKGHRNTTYTGEQGSEAPKGRGRRRLARERDPMRRTGYMESAAPGVDPEVRDPAGLMGVKSTNSPDTVEIPSTPCRYVVIGGLTPLSLVAVMRSHLNQPGNLI